MKKRFLISLSIVLVMTFSLTLPFVLMGCTVDPSPNTIKVMSYNIKVVDFFQEIVESDSSYSKRKERLSLRISEEMPDILGFQEATSIHMADIMDLYGQYYEDITYYREGGFENPMEIMFGVKQDEASPILYRKDKFELIEHGCYWLSDTPDVVGSNTWGAEHVRICTWARLKIIETGVEFVYYNTHLNWGEAQYKATVLLRELMPVDVPYFITGDFNLRPDSSNYALWAEFMTDTRSSPINMAETPTSNGFDAPDNDSIIDYCFCR